MGIFHRNLVALRPAEKSDEDLQFLFMVFNSTRAAEMAMTGWSELEVESFLRMQFRDQDLQYRQNYPNASFNIILVNDTPSGRFYVSRGRVFAAEMALLTFILSLSTWFTGAALDSGLDPRTVAVRLALLFIIPGTLWTGWVITGRRKEKHKKK